MRTDKVLVKKFVEDKLGSEWVIATLWHGPILPPLNQRNWLVPFVLKPNHGSGMNMFIRSLDDLDWPKIEHICREWMGFVYGKDRGEWAYFSIKPQILVEPFIGGRLTLPVDYKFLVFHGTAEFVQVDIGREHNHTRAIFDREWLKGALLVEISSPAMIASLPAAAASDGTRPEHRWQLFAPRPNSQSFKFFGARPSVSFRPLLLRLPLDRIRRALSYVDANKIVVAPDCGLKSGIPRMTADLP